MRNILIVEDDENLRQLYKEVFIRSGYNVTEAIDPNEALESLKENTFDAVLLDLLFPSMDGEDVIKFIRSGKTENTKVPIIVLTNLSADEKIKKVLEIGATKCIFKVQNTPKSIFNEVESVLAKESADIEVKLNNHE